GGGITVNGSVGAATDGGGSGSTAVGASGGANTGGGGGAGGSSGSGGAGGSGLVLVRFKTGTATVSATGGYTVSTISVMGESYTVYRFTSSGSFTVSALNPS